MERLMIRKRAWKMTVKVTGRAKRLSPLSKDASLLWVGIFSGCRVFRSLFYAMAEEIRNYPRLP